MPARRSRAAESATTSRQPRPLRLDRGQYGRGVRWGHEMASRARRPAGP